MELMYPAPTVLSKHTFVPLTANGDKLGKALTTDDPKLAASSRSSTASAPPTPGAFGSFMRATASTSPTRS